MLPKVLTIEEAFEAFCLAKRSENVMPGTLRNYDWTMQRWAEHWPGLTLTATTPEHVRGFVLWLQGQGISSSTVHIHFRNIRALLRWCEAEEMIGAGVLRNVRGPKVVEQVPDVLTETEAADLLVAVKASKQKFAFRDYTILLFFLVTGVRLAELAGMNVDDLNLPGGYALVREGKGRKQRLVPLGDLLPVEVKRYIIKHRTADKTQPALFVNEDGARLHKQRVQKIVISDLTEFVDRNLGRNGPHTLRHTACTFMLRKLKDIKRVAVIMGHSNLETTERYTHLTFDDLRGVDRPTLEQLLTARPTKRARRALMLTEGSQV